MVLDEGVALRVAIDGDSAFFLVFVVFIVDVVVNKVEDELLHIEAFGLFESEDTFVVEEECERPHGSEVTAELVENRADVAHGAGGIVGERVDEDGHAVRTVTFIRHALILALVLAHGVFDGTFDVVLGHVLTLARSDDRAQRRIVFGFRTAGFYGNGDLLA